MNSACTVCDSVQWLQLFICKHGRAPFLLMPVNNCSRKKDSVTKEQAVVELFCAFNGVFSVLCRTRRLWRMSANRSSNSGRTTAADRKPKEKAMMVFNFCCAVSLKKSSFSTLILCYYKVKNRCTWRGKVNEWDVGMWVYGETAEKEAGIELTKTLTRIFIL